MFRVRQLLDVLMWELGKCHQARVWMYHISAFDLQTTEKLRTTLPPFRRIAMTMITSPVCQLALRAGVYGP